MFAYCNNNPVNSADPSGMFWKEIGNFFKNVYNKVKTVIKNNFGTQTKNNTIIKDTGTIKANVLNTVIVKTGTKTSKKTSIGAKKTVTGYTAPKDLKAGVDLNVNEQISIGAHAGLDGLGTNVSYTGEDGGTFNYSFNDDIASFNYYISTGYTDENGNQVEDYTCITINKVPVLMAVLYGVTVDQYSNQNNDSPVSPHEKMPLSAQ